jgi:hypothetical protein
VENGNTTSGAWSLIAKIGTGVFATIVAPFVVGLLLKYFDSPPPPAAQPVVGDAQPKPSGEKVAESVSSAPASIARADPVPSVPAPIAKAPTTPKVAPARDAGRPPNVPKLDLAAVDTVAPHKTKKKKSAAEEVVQSRAAAGFRPLFNGRDLSGWTGGDKRWSVNVAGRSLVGHANDGTKGDLHTWLYTERNFSDFRLRFEYRALPQSNSGFTLRVSQGAKSDERLEIQLLGDQDHVVTTGTIIGLRADNGHPNTKPATPVSLRNQGEWNVVEVDLRGQRLRLTINGHSVHDVRFDRQSDQSSRGKRIMGDSGRIALQSRLGHVEFRRIEIEELARPAARQKKAGS